MSIFHAVRTPLSGARPVLCLLLVLALGLTFRAGDVAAAGGGPLQTLDMKGLQKLVRDSKGKPVVLNFFATWCPPCRAEIPLLVEMNKKHAGRVVIVGLTVDDDSSVAKVLPFVAKMKIDYPVYRVTPEVVRRFSIRSIPFNVGYDSRGTMGWAFSGILDEDTFDTMVQELAQ